MLNYFPVAIFGNLGTPELLLFAVVLILLFGSAKLPSLMRNLGRSATEFKRGMKEDVDEPADRIDSRKDDSANT